MSLKVIDVGDGMGLYHISREDECGLFLSSHCKYSRPSTPGCQKPTMGQDIISMEKRIGSRRYGG
jgi:hypothetical protein